MSELETNKKLDELLKILGALQLNMQSSIFKTNANAEALHRLGLKIDLAEKNIRDLQEETRLNTKYRAEVKSVYSKWLDRALTSLLTILLTLITSLQFLNIK